MSIQVLGEPWNPATGCTKISPGCKNCYAEPWAHRLHGMNNIRYVNGFKLTTHPPLVDLPRKIKKSQVYFVNSMSDLFHKDIPLDFIQAVFKTMNECPQHTFQILTKRSDILKQLAPSLTWTPNIWMGVSVENQDYAYRIEDLQQTPAAIKFVSVEPLIGPLTNLNLDGIDWVLLGGESGPGWRPMDVSWVRDIRDQCVNANVPFFFKQYAGLNPEKLGRDLDGKEWSEMPNSHPAPPSPPASAKPQRVLLPPKQYTLFSPKRVFVNIKSVGLAQTDEYLKRIRKYNPDVVVEEYEGKFQYPQGMDPAQMYHYMKETVLISERSQGAPFFECFPSPGNCVEGINTMAKLTWQCIGQCHYCYLMLTEPHEHYFYTNLEQFEDQLATAPFAHRVILSVWNIASQAQKRQFPKIPYHLRNAAEDIRKDCVQIGVLSDNEAKEYLHQHLLTTILENLKQYWAAEFPNDKCPYTDDNIAKPYNELAKIYDQCAKLPLEINPGEYSDIVSVDHLTGHLDYLMNLLPRFPDVNIDFRTKYTYLDELLKHDGLGRVTIKMNFNTPYAIQEFEPNAPPLEDRIASLKRIQNAKGFNTKIVIEPIIPYPGHRKDYADLIHQIMGNIDCQKTTGIIIGAIRYKVTEGSLPITAVRNYPNTKILDTEEILQTSQRNDGRKRYSVEWRCSIYEELIEIIRSYSPKADIHLGAETEEVWNRLGLNVKNYMSESVVQFNVDGDPMKPEIEQTNTTNIPTPTQPANPPTPPTPIPIYPDLTSVERIFTEDEASIKYHVAIAGIGVGNAGKKQSMSGHNEVLEMDFRLQRMGDPKQLERSEWDKIFSQRIQKALLKDFYTPVKIVGWIADISQPFPVRPRNRIGAKVSRGLDLVITDSEGEFLETLAIPVEQSFYDIKKKNKRVVFCGTIVPVVTTGRRMENRFYLWDIIPNWNAEDLIEIETADNEGKRENQKKLNELFVSLTQKKNGVFKYIKNKLVTELGIQGLDKMPELDRSIDVMIYQAFSDGLNDAPAYSNRIHSLIIGPPGRGKKFLRDIAHILNPVCGKATTVQGKISIAGLTASEARILDRAGSLPGLLPLNSGGVLTFEDFHQLKGARKSVLNALSETMEDGKVTVSNVSMITHEAVTAIHVDMNRKSQVEPKGDSSFEDVDIAYNMISRFDYIVDLPKDMEAMLDSVKKSLRNTTSSTSYPQDESIPEWQRELKRIVAYMRTNWRAVEYGPGVTDYIYTKITESFGLNNAEQTVSETVIQDNIQRVTRSVLRFVKAIACVNHSDKITIEYVDRAFIYIGDKIKYLSTVNPDDGNGSSDPRTIRVKERLEENLSKLPARFRTGDYVSLRGPLKKGTDKKTAQMEATRDLDKLQKSGFIKKIGQGQWEKESKTNHPKKAEKQPNKHVSSRKPSGKKSRK